MANAETIQEKPDAMTWFVVGGIFTAILVMLYAPLVIELSKRAGA